MQTRTFGLMLVTLTATACASRAAPAPRECLAPATLDANAPVTRFDIHFEVGGQMLTTENAVSFFDGSKVKASKARFFLSQIALQDMAGSAVAAELVDASGRRAPYGVVLVDFERPETMRLNIKAPAGDYRGLSLSVGVPGECESGEQLNHSDASAMKPPLDVDSDMYWSWNPGYVFLKFEGQVSSGAAPESFFFHVGEDKRLARLELTKNFSLSVDGDVGPEIIADFERLLTTSSGEARPDITQAQQRRVHGGDWADALAENIRNSGFLRLEAAHH